MKRDSNMLIFLGQEAQSNYINLPDDDPKVVENMIRYFYLLNYEPDKDSGLYIAQTNYGTYPVAADLNIDHAVDFEVCAKIMRLQHALPGLHIPPLIGLKMLIENNFDENHARNQLFRTQLQANVVYDCALAKQWAEKLAM